MMHHVVDQPAATHSIEATVQHHHHYSAMDIETTSPSSFGSPKSPKTSIDPNASQVSESTLQSVAARELTPPSSVASVQGQNEVDQTTNEDAHPTEKPAPPAVTGKKRTANGQVKHTTQAPELQNVPEIYAQGQSQDDSTTSQACGTSVGELSQQLKTKLTYAMLKVQNGWQRHSIDEIESITSQSPRSNLSGFTPYQSLVSPRSALADGMRQNSDSSSSSDRSHRHRSSLSAMTTSDATTTTTRKGLAPPAPIFPGNRRRPTPNVHLQINSSSTKLSRPVATQRTPSQNAAMEADAVETLLFMSASPSNSGHFPSHLSAYSPTSQVFSATTSPLKAHFSANEHQFVANPVRCSPRSSIRRVKYENKAALIDRLLNELDDDESEELDRAVQIIDQHHAAKLSA